jgi:hypothetical protein
MFPAGGNRLELRESQKPAPTAEESAKRWLELRNSQKAAPGAGESAGKREHEGQVANSMAAAEERSHERGRAENVDDDGQGRKGDRSHDHDYGS